MNDKTIIIAEAGVNHNGSLLLAKKLIDVAVDAGADYVKFQTFKTETLVTRVARKATYQTKNINDHDEFQFEMLKKLELTESMHEELIAYSKLKGIKFLSSAFDNFSIDFLDNLGIELFKIPSGEITNKPYLQHIAHKHKPIILSTGMADLNEIGEALNILLKEGLMIEQITVLHCTTEYPAPLNEVNLRAMKTIAEKFNVKTGYSDHTEGIQISLAAVALGASIVEKHFTLDKNMKGPDHKASLEPFELVKLVEGIRKIELALGNGIKTPSDSEIKNTDVVRKSIHLKTDLKRGHILTEEDLIMKRPGKGISPMLVDEVIGKQIISDIEADEMLKWEDLG
jgi:N,N'-diacetyllegionaminate synthase